MNLNDLKPPGTRLAEVEPLFQGMPLAEWLAKIERSRAEAYFETPAWRKLREAQRWDRRKAST